MSTGSNDEGRYAVGFTFCAPWIVSVTVHDSDTLTPEELAKAMPRIAAAMERALADQRRHRQALER
jgi:hypothetical protein